MRAAKCDAKGNGRCKKDVRRRFRWARAVGVTSAQRCADGSSPLMGWECIGLDPDSGNGGGRAVYRGVRPISKERQTQDRFCMPRTGRLVKSRQGLVQAREKLVVVPDAWRNSALINLSGAKLWTLMSTYL